jgi:thymidine kinase
MAKRIGFLEIIAGPMYCGKTEELIRQVKRARIGKKCVQVFKHKIDIRYGTEAKVFSHGGHTFECELIEKPEEILHLLNKKTEIVGIDEAQWFGSPLLAVVTALLKKNIHVIITALPLTYDRQPFTPIPELMALSDKVTKLSAVCNICGQDAVFHKRITKGPKVDPLTSDPSLVKALDDNVFVARCRACFSKKP